MFMTSNIKVKEYRRSCTLAVDLQPAMGNGHSLTHELQPKNKPCSDMLGTYQVWGQTHPNVLNALAHDLQPNNKKMFGKPVSNRNPI
jgi:hypothetical protein